MRTVDQIKEHMANVQVERDKLFAERNAIAKRAGEQDRLLRKLQTELIEAFSANGTPAAAADHKGKK